MSKSRAMLGLLLGFFGMCLFAGTLPATRLAVTGFDPLFLTMARATIAGCAGLLVLFLTGRALPKQWLRPEIAVAGFAPCWGFRCWPRSP
jgi:drug/metabolite transporter (DMT)-like permease